jgi:hypothetical protein
MGWFGDIVRSVGKTIGRGVETFGNIVGNETISSWGRNIQDACTERIASEKSYDKREANIYTTDRLNEVLVSFSEGYSQQATAIENSCIRLVEEYYDRLINIIESAPNSVNNTANIKALKSGKRRIAKTISGGIKEPLAKRMSLDDSECLRILKMDSGTEKKRAMTNFTKKVINESLDHLSKNVREALNDQTEDIQEYLNSISEEQEKNMQALKEQFDKMVRDNELEQDDREKHCVVPLYIVNVSDCICDILKKE